MYPRRWLQRLSEVSGRHGRARVVSTGVMWDEGAQINITPNGHATLDAARKDLRSGRFSGVWFMGPSWNNFGAFKGEDWLPDNPKRRLSNDLWF
jgi:hypothetical protein